MTRNSTGLRAWQTIHLREQEFDGLWFLLVSGPMFLEQTFTKWFFFLIVLHRQNMKPTQEIYSTLFVQHLLFLKVLYRSIDLTCLFCDRSDSRRALKLRESSTVMQPNSSEPDARAGNGLSLTLQQDHLTRTPGSGSAAANPESHEVRVPMASEPGESVGGTSSSRRSRVSFHGHPHSHSHGHNRAQHHSNSEPELDPPDPDLDSGEPSSSLSELRCLFRWLQKSLPFLIILCAKLVIQHTLGEYEWCREHSEKLNTREAAPIPSLFPGLAVGVGLFTTFLYVNKSIQTQVFLQVSQEHEVIDSSSQIFSAVRILIYVFTRFRIITQSSRASGCCSSWSFQRSCSTTLFSLRHFTIGKVQLIWYISRDKSILCHIDHCIHMLAKWTAPYLTAKPGKWFNLQELWLLP